MKHTFFQRKLIVCAALAALGFSAIGVKIALAADAEKDSDGNTLRFGVPLSRDAAGLAGLVHDLARWVTGLAVKEIQAQQAHVERATSQTRAAAPKSPG